LIIAFDGVRKTAKMGNAEDYIPSQLRRHRAAARGSLIKRIEIIFAAVDIKLIERKSIRDSEVIRNGIG
jgi:hypothetical protein